MATEMAAPSRLVGQRCVPGLERGDSVSATVNLRCCRLDCRPLRNTPTEHRRMHLRASNICSTPHPNNDHLIRPRTTTQSLLPLIRCQYVMAGTLRISRSMWRFSITELQRLLCYMPLHRPRHAHLLDDAARHWTRAGVGVQAHRPFAWRSHTV